ncbi:MAG: anaerobic ribonucleoside-triphosphate reductase activating protein [Lachnospiraceae bacterium]|nr:anaerobic ribonucleoside-triphosphate reductase activating protein [Lachnospiraceae bacterium]
MEFHGFNKLTLLDYPGKLACTLFTGYCNFKCPFCHNAELVLHPDSQPALSEDTIIRQIKSRASMIEGVAITGGEPTLHKDLPDFIKRLRDETGLSIKLDTNGTAPDMLKELLDNRLIDYVAMDIKSSPDGYAKATGLNTVSMSELFSSVDMIIDSGIEYEFRTTVVDGLHTETDFLEIGKWIKGAKRYFLQCYKDSGDLIAPMGLKAPSRDKLERFRNVLLPYVPETRLRGVD